jgi:hypothetical protein
VVIDPLRLEIANLSVDRPCMPILTNKMKGSGDQVGQRRSLAYFGVSALLYLAFTLVTLFLVNRAF